MPLSLGHKCRESSGQLFMSSTFGKIRESHSAKYVRSVRQNTWSAFGKKRTGRQPRSKREESFLDAILFDFTNYRLSPMYIGGS